MEKEKIKEKICIECGERKTKYLYCSICRMKNERSQSPFKRYNRPTKEK